MEKILFILLITFLNFAIVLAQHAPFISARTSESNSSAFKEHVQKTIKPGVDYAYGIVITKLKPEWRHALSADRFGESSDEAVFNNMQFRHITPLFPNHHESENNKVDLSLIYEMHFDSSADIPLVCGKLMNTGMFEYAEPRYYSRPFIIQNHNSQVNPNEEQMLLGFIPDDSLYQQQSGVLEKIKATEAWAVEQGDSNVVIGFVDSGTDFLHPDLVENVAYNYADPINDIDDDHNGYIDDFQGWDISNNDNDPNIPLTNQDIYHGTWTVGAASATTDNVKGIASPGFRCRFLPVKASDDQVVTTFLNYAYEGIVYAADQGVKVINCSWGDNNPSKYNADIIKYAVLDRDALVICSAGNSGIDEELVPAAFEYTMSVAGTELNDKKVSYSTYNSAVDISAPIASVTTGPNGRYVQDLTGTSFAAPLVSGAAALVRSHFPNLTALQTRERLRMTSDPVDQLNPLYSGKMGKGRLNMLRALTETNVRSVRFEEVRFTDFNDDVFRMGDTVRIIGTLVNYLDPTSDLVCTMTSAISDITFLSDTFSAGHLATMDSMSNSSSPFAFIINADAAKDVKLSFRILFNDGDYEDWQTFNSDQRANVSYTVIGNDIISTTSNSTGRFGVMYDGNYDAAGFHYFPADSIEFRMSALMIGNNPTKVSDATYNYYPDFENDFKLSDPIHHVTESMLADQVYECTFNDSLINGPTRLGLDIQQNIYLWDGDKFLISEYIMTNKSNRNYTSLYVGLNDEIDIGLGTYTRNRSDQDSILKLGYLFSTEGTTVVSGTQVLTPTPFLHYAIEWSNTYGGVDITNGFTNPEKYLALSSQRSTAGFNDSLGIDCQQVVSTGPLSLASGETIVVAFALLAGSSLQDLKESAGLAQLRYDAFGTTSISENRGISKLKVFPNPVHNEVQFSFEGGNTSNRVSARIYDMQGHLLMEKQIIGNAGNIYLSGFSPGIYLLRIVNGDQISMAIVSKW